MPMMNVHIPYGAYWSTPFTRWQGALASLHSVELAARVATNVLGRKKIPATAFDGIALGMTVP